MAPAFEALQGGRTEPLPEPPAPRHSQASLFPSAAGGNGMERDPSAVEQAPRNPKVIPIPMLTPVRAAQRKSTRGAPGIRTDRRSDAFHQSSLNFAGGDGTEAFDLKVEAVIYCDAPVATVEHRLTAAVADGAWMALGVGVFALTFFGGISYWNIPAPVFHRQMVMILVAAAGMIGLSYKLLCANVKGDTPGMRFARLRLVNFDGRIPSRRQRLIRQAASVLSLLALGLGLLWALVDEENLTWHDHISKTFPTPG